MSDPNQFGERFQETLEAHERAVKRSLESLGQIQAELREVADELDDDRTQDRLTDIGRRVETHEDHLETTVETLDEFKRLLGEFDSDDRSALDEAMEMARRRARQEPHPKRPDDHDES